MKLGQGARGNTTCPQAALGPHPAWPVGAELEWQLQHNLQIGAFPFPPHVPLVVSFVRQGGDQGSRTPAWHVAVLHKIALSTRPVPSYVVALGPGLHL